MNQTLTLQLIDRSSRMQNLVMVTSDCDQVTSTVLVPFHRVVVVVVVVARPASPACLPSFQKVKGKQNRVRPLLAWILAANAPTQSSGAPVTITGASSKNYQAFSIRNSQTAKSIEM